MRYLIISCFLLIVSCASYPKKQRLTKLEDTKKSIINPYFSDINQDYVYKAHIDIYERSFGGLLIIKKIADENHRVVFTTEMGAKLFDFTFTKNDFLVNSIIDQLDKKMLINILKTDFRTLIHEKNAVMVSFSKHDKTIYQTKRHNKKHYYFYKNHELNQIVRSNQGKEKIQFLFLEINNHIAKQIKIKHHNIKLEINLKLITP